MIKPLKNKVAVVRIKKKQTTVSGIILQSDVDGEVDRCKVIAIGPEVTLVKLDEILFIDWNKATPGSGPDNTPYYVVKEDDVVGVFED
jgi:co-chaperonin GroES (HSP10)